MPSRRAAAGAAGRPRTHPQRLMWITPGRVFYAGLLGAPSVRTIGGLVVYTALQAPVRLSLDGGAWEEGTLAVVPPYTPHRVACEARLIGDLIIEPETVDLARLPDFMRARRGVVEGPEAGAALARVRAAHERLRLAGVEPARQGLDFDTVFFGQALPGRSLDARIAQVIARIEGDLAAQTPAQELAASVNLSFSRFLHLFSHETGAPLRRWRTWKRARSLLHYVTRETNLAELALGSGYPDASHFSHSIRQVFGLSPSDIFSGSRKLALYGEEPGAS